MDPGLIPYPQLFEGRADSVDNGIWPGTDHVLLLQRLINLHFAGDDDQYWNLGIWAYDLYFNDSSIIFSVHMWKVLYTIRWDTLASVMEQVLLLQAQLASQSQDVLPASANEDGEDAMDLQGGGGHSLEDLKHDWLDISYVEDTPVPCR